MSKEIPCSGGLGRVGRDLDAEIRALLWVVYLGGVRWLVHILHVLLCDFWCTSDYRTSDLDISILFSSECCLFFDW